MWTNENRARYDRSHLRYPSDLTDDEWKLDEPLIPPGRRGGDAQSDSVFNFENLTGSGFSDTLEGNSATMFSSEARALTPSPTNMRRQE